MTRKTKRNRGGGGAHKTKSKNRKSFQYDDVDLEDDGLLYGNAFSAPRPHFSLQDEVRSTGLGFHGLSINLRQKHILFVPASDSTPKVGEDPTVQKEQESTLVNIPSAVAPAPPITNNAVEASTSTSRTRVRIETHIKSLAVRQNDQLVTEDQPIKADSSTQQGNPFSFVIDTVGNTSLAPTILSISPRSELYQTKGDRVQRRSSISSTSSDEVVFKGRAPVIIKDDPIKAVKESPQETLQRSSTNDNSANDRLFQSLNAVESTKTFSPPYVFKRGTSRREPKSGRSRRQIQQQEEEQLVYGDYLENIRAQENQGEEEDMEAGKSVFLLKDMSLDDDNDWTQNPEEVYLDSIPGQTMMPGDWDDTMLDAFDDASTSQGLDVLVDRIVSRRERSSGTQYLVVYEGYTLDDARWIPKSILISNHEVALVKKFEEIQAMNKPGSASASSDEDQWEDDDGEDEEDDEDEDFESEDEEGDDDDLIRRRIDRMTDEKIAQLLAKQEELGLGSDEIILFDDHEEEEEDDENKNIFDLLEDSSSRNGTKTRSSERLRSSNKRTGGFPSASLMAEVLEQDPYNGFDIMDFERPSLKTKVKGRRGTLPFELEDEELQAILESTYENDLIKKAIKRKEREELRALGLLGRGNKAQALMTDKYKEGMPMSDLQGELSLFLTSSSESWALPPMDKKFRKMIHQIAGVFNVKSKSTGSGHKRFTTLIKTQRTLDFDADLFRRAERKLAVGFFPRPQAKKNQKARGIASGGGTAAARYRDGDIVGFGAAELGSENRGRAMLEKMGWTSGTALGAVNNKGILQPVSHVVKITKAGLG